MEFENAKKYRRDITRLYKSAFPPEERAPLWFLFRRAKDARDSFFAVTDHGRFVGLAYTIRMNQLVYVFYLAIQEEYRGCGYGGLILEELKGMFPGCVLTLSIEDPHDASADNREERLRRLAFYEKHGFHDLYIKTNEAGVTYELLGTDQSARQVDYLKLMEDYLGRSLFKFVFKETVIQDTQL